MIRDQIIETILAQVREPDGMNAAALNFSRATKYIYTKQLQDEGRIFKARKGNIVRYFDARERGESWAASLPRKPSIYSATKRKAVKEGWGRDDPCHITSETRVTIAPTPPAPTRTNTFSPWG
jgi:hypothetical protein